MSIINAIGDLKPMSIMKPILIGNSKHFHLPFHRFPPHVLHLNIMRRRIGRNHKNQYSRAHITITQQYTSKSLQPIEI
jgi:hypothetical protein